MQSIRKQFSLDWLSGSEKRSPDNPPSQAQAALDEALIFYGQPIIRQLEQAPNREMGLHDLAHKLNADIKNFQFETLWEVIKYLDTKSLVELVDTSDPAGNYTIRLGRNTTS